MTVGLVDFNISSTEYGCLKMKKDGEHDDLHHWILG